MAFLEKEEARLTPTVSEDDARADLDRLHARRERWLEMYAEGKCSKDDLDRHVQALDVEEAAIRRLLESHEYAAAARNRVAVTLEDLMGLRVEDTGEVDPNADADPTRGSSQWREWLVEQVVAAFHHDKPLSSWAVEEVAYFSEALDLRVGVTASDDWQKPTVTLGVGSESVQEYLDDWRLGPVTAPASAASPRRRRRAARERRVPRVRLDAWSPPPPDLDLPPCG